MNAAHFTSEPTEESFNLRVTIDGDELSMTANTFGIKLGPAGESRGEIDVETAHEIIDAIDANRNGRTIRASDESLETARYVLDEVVSE